MTRYDGNTGRYVRIPEPVQQRPPVMAPPPAALPPPIEASFQELLSPAPRPTPQPAPGQGGGGLSGLLGGGGLGNLLGSGGGLSSLLGGGGLSSLLGGGGLSSLLGGDGLSRLLGGGRGAASSDAPDSASGEGSGTSALDGLGKLFSKFLRPNIELEDLMLVGIFYLLYRESQDIEFLLMAGAMLFL